MFAHRLLMDTMFEGQLYHETEQKNGTVMFNVEMVRLISHGLGQQLWTSRTWPGMLSIE